MSTNETVYAQDCEFVRYQDGLMWSRFQTMAAIEAAILYGQYEARSLVGLDKLVLLSIGAVLVFLCCLLAFINRRVSLKHLERVKDFEKGVHIEPFNSQKWAGAFLWTVAVVLNGCNIWIIARLLCIRP